MTNSRVSYTRSVMMGDRSVSPLSYIQEVLNAHHGSLIIIPGKRVIKDSTGYPVLPVHVILRYQGKAIQYFYDLYHSHTMASTLLVHVAKADRELFDTLCLLAKQYWSDHCLDQSSGGGEP